MDDPVVVLPDSTLSLLTFLRPLIAARPEESCTDVRVARTVKPSEGPCIQVRHASGTQGTPAHDNPVVDFLVFHDSPDEAMEVARIAAALCRSARGTAGVSFERELLAPVHAIDPVDGQDPQVFFRHQFFTR